MSPDLEKLCNTVHALMQDATTNLSIPSPEKARTARKKIAVFTYSIVREIAEEAGVNCEKLYEQYLLMGGLTQEQASIISRRTQEEFIFREFGEECIQAGKTAFHQWQSGDKDISPLIKGLI